MSVIDNNMCLPEDIIDQLFFDNINTNTEYFAIGDHTCCMTCGHSEIENALLDNEYTIENKKGYIFYHSQNTDDILKQMNQGSDIEVYLCYGMFTSDYDTQEEYESMYDILKSTIDNDSVLLEWDKCLTKKMKLIIKKSVWSQ